MDSATRTPPVVGDLRVATDAMGAAAGQLGSAYQLGDHDVETGLSLLVRLQSRVAAVQAVLLAEVESRNLKAATGAPSTPRWLTDRLQLSRADGGARLRQSVALRRHPALLAALAAGTVTVEQGEVLAAVLHQVAGLPGLTDAEVDAAAEFLVDQCPHLGPRELARAGQAVIETLTRTPSVEDPADADAVAREHGQAERALQQADRNWLTVTHRPGGRARIRVDLGPVGTAGFLDWCRRNADTPAAGTDGFEDTRSRAERRGDALADLVNTGAATTGLDPATSDTEPTDQTGEPDSSGGSGGSGGGDQAGLFETDPDVDDADDADVDDVDPSGANGDADDADPVGMPGPPGPRTGEVVLNVITTLADLRAGVPGTAHLDTGAPLSVAAVRQLACDAHIVPVVMNGTSQVLDLGRCRRPFNRAQRRAAALRDRGCVAPGCDQPPAACHLHHAHWWSRGGPTDLDNAALLCGYHHRMVHRQDWAITLATNGYPQLHPPPAIDPTGRPRQHHRFTIQAALRPAGSGRVAPHLRT